MKVLILGGTVFLGRAIATAASEQGHDVAILSRGRSGPDPDGVRVFRGDRDRPDGLRALDGQLFDVVVDTSRQSVGQVRRAVETLRDRTERYVYTSTISVYRDFSEPGNTEDSPTHEPLWPTSPEQEADPGNYPALNSACERLVLDAFGDRGLVVRPGLIVGDHDPTDRFGYWPARLSRGGTVLAPGAPDRPVQFIDVHDVAEFIVRAARDARTGVYNVRGPATPLTMHDFLAVCRRKVGAASELVWVDDRFLADREVRSYLDLPLWLSDDPEWAGFASVDATKALEAGLSHRPIEDTIAAAMRTEQRLGLERDRRAGLSSQREAELLEEWRRVRR